MFNKIRLILLKILMPRADIRTIIIALGITEEEYTRRYNNPEHPGYKKESLNNALKDIERLTSYFYRLLDLDYGQYKQIVKERKL